MSHVSFSEEFYVADDRVKYLMPGSGCACRV